MMIIKTKVTENEDKSTRNSELFHKVDNGQMMPRQNHITYQQTRGNATVRRRRWIVRKAKIDRNGKVRNKDLIEMMIWK